MRMIESDKVVPLVLLLLMNHPAADEIVRCIQEIVDAHTIAPRKWFDAKIACIGSLARTKRKNGSIALSIISISGRMRFAHTEIGKKVLINVD